MSGDTLPALSKRDAVALGVADVPGPQLRARVFLLEGCVADLTLAVEEALVAWKRERTLPPLVLARLREAATTARARYGEGEIDD